MAYSVRSQIDIFLALVTVSSVVAIDRFSKIFFSQILSVGESLPVIPRIFHITLVHNTGIAFGLFKNHGLVFVIIPIIVVGLLVFNIFYYKNNNQELSRLYIVAFSMILGGAMGNLIDRIAFGYVIDFLDFRVWPVFNAADSAITIGAFLIGLKCFQMSK